MSILDKNMLGGESPRLPIDGLPYMVQEIITTYANALNCPAEFVAGAAMAAAAQAAGNKFVWSNGQYTCYPQFYTALLGDSTANKTTAIRSMMKPLERYDRQSFAEWEQATAGKNKDEKARTPYQIGLLKDYTLEAYQDALKFNPNGVTAYADEIISFFGNFNKYRGNGADEKFFLSVFANYSDYSKSRRGYGIDMIPTPIVRIIGGIQPEILQPTFGGSTMLCDGMLPRFLWYAVPEDFRFDETGTHTDTHHAEADWRNIIIRLFNQQGNVRLVLDNEAQRLYDDFKIEHAKAKNRKTLYGYEAAVCGKLEIYAIIWAMTSRILRYASDEADTFGTLTILGCDMQYSLKCMDYFRHTAMMVYNLIKQPERKITIYEAIRALVNQCGLKASQTDFARCFNHLTQEQISMAMHNKR